MRHRYLASIASLAGVVVLVSLAVASMAGQTTSTSKPPALPKPGPAPKTAWGEPDLQGTWFVMEAVPFERTAANANKPLLTDEEVEAADKAKAVNVGRNARNPNSATQDVEGAYNAVFNSILRTSKRTSMIIDPPDGRIPPLAAGAAERARAAEAAARKGKGPADSAGDLSLGTRCVSYGTPNIRAGYQSYFEITQGPGVVALRSEMIHDARIFSTDKPSLVSSAIRQYHGDSRAHWEGDFFVVETGNYTANATRVGATDKLKTIEKFRRVAADTLEYYVTFDDPTVWSRPWTLMIPLKMTGEAMFEYACHEGNYGLPAILRGAREQERGTR